MPDIDKTIILSEQETASACTKGSTTTPPHEATATAQQQPSSSKAASSVVYSAEETEMSLHALSESIRKVNDFASGGQGVLSQGVDLSLHRTIAVKTLRKELAADAEKRSAFIREARITAQLEHPSIIPVHSLHTDSDYTLAVTMKLVHGQDLHTYLQLLIEKYEKEGFDSSFEEKSLLERLEIFMKICDALDFAHSRNVMHCDLKPANIMLGEYHDAYLMDWGLAHPIRDEFFAPGKPVPKSSIAGTPKYIAPETFMEKYSDQRADIYSMGMILFELVTLRSAIPELSVKEMLQLVCDHKLLPTEHRFGHSINPDMRAIIAKATAYDPADRYQKIGDLARDIRRFLQREEVSARPDNLFRKIFRSCIIRHGKAMAIIALSCLLVLAGLSAFLLNRQLKEERLDNIFNMAVDQKFIECQEMADQLDHEMVELEHNLTDFTRTLTLLLDGKLKPEFDGPVEQHAIPYQDYLDPYKAPDTFIFNNQQEIKLDFAHVGYRVFDGAVSQQDAAVFPLQAAALLPQLQNILLDSQFDSTLNEMNRQALLEDLPFSQTPANLVYFSTLDGRHLVYPGKAYQPSYDPRKRQWFTDRLGSQLSSSLRGSSSGWSTPYLNYGETGLVMSYTILINDSDGNPRGVAALDLDVNCLLDFVLKREKSTPGLLEKCFMNDKGYIISTTDPHLMTLTSGQYRQYKGGGASGYLYPQRAVLQMMRQTSKGYLEINEEGQKVLYIYAKCKTVNWFYMERIALEQIAMETN